MNLTKVHSSKPLSQQNYPETKLYKFEQIIDIQTLEKEVTKKIKVRVRLL
jgi:hypothetical protein